MIAIEGVVAMAFIGATMVGLWWTAWTVPVAYVAHGLWGIAHHRRIITVAPGWYIPFCATSYWVFA